MSEGYVDDRRNTDNAWVETTVLNIHLDGSSQETVDINNMVGNIISLKFNTDVHHAASEALSFTLILSSGQGSPRLPPVAGGEP